MNKFVVYVRNVPLTGKCKVQFPYNKTNKKVLLCLTLDAKKK